MINHDGNYAFGYVAAHDLDQDVVDILLGYTFGAKDFVNHSEEEARRQDEAEQRAAWEQRCEDEAVLAQEEGRSWEHDDFEFEAPDDGYAINEPTISGTYEGVHYQTSWLGGALNFFIFRSPFIATKAGLASPACRTPPFCRRVPAARCTATTCHRIGTLRMCEKR